MKTSLLFLLGLSTALFADYTMVLETGERGEQQTIEYKDDKHIKVNMDQDSGMLVIGEKAYMVNSEDGETKVIDMDEMRAMMGGFTGGLKEKAKEVQDEMDMKVIKKGKSKRVAGIKGQVWTIEYDQDGETKRSDVVVTSDKRVVKTMSAYGKAISRMAMSPEESDDEFMQMMQIAPGHVIIQADSDEEGGSFTLKSFSERSIPASTFALPSDAKQQKMPDMSALFGGSAAASGGESKGIMSDCFNKVCCGSTDGDAEVLTRMLRASKSGYKLEGRPSVCNAMGISSLFGSSDIEGGLYKKGKDDYIQITLDMSGSGEGTVHKTPGGVKDHKNGTVSGHKYEYGYLEPMHQQTLDIMLDDGAVLTVTRTSTKKIDLVSWSKGAIDLGAYHASTQAKSPAKSAKSGSSDAKKDDSGLDTEAISEGVDDVVNTFKSFF